MKGPVLCSVVGRVRGLGRAGQGGLAHVTSVHLAALGKVTCEESLWCGGRGEIYQIIKSV